MKFNFLAMIAIIALCIIFSADASTYTVKSGDTLSAIASRTHCSLSQLVSINHIKNANIIHVGQVITLCGSSPSPSPSPKPSPSPAPTGGWKTPDGAYATHWNQCDSSFGRVAIGSSTVCKIGCLLTSLTVALRNHKVPLNGSTNYNPGDMARFFSSHGGFSGNLLIHTTVSKLGSGASRYLGQRSLSWSEMNSNLASGNSLVCLVNHGAHWVNIYGVNSADKSTFLSRDSGAGRSTFKASEILKCAIYHLRP